MKDKHFARFIKGNWLWFAVAVVIIIVMGLTRTLAPALVQGIIDRLESGTYQGVIPLILFALMFHFIGHAASAGSESIGRFLETKFAIGLRLRLYTHLTKVKLMELEKYTTGDLQSILRNDVNQAAGVFSMTMYYLYHLSLIFFGAFFLITVSPQVAIVVLCANILFSLLSQRFLRVIKKYETRVRQSLGAISNTLLEALCAADVIKTYKAKNYIAKLFRRERADYNKSAMHSAKTDTVRLFLYDIVYNASLFGSAIYLGYGAMRGTTTVGSMLAGVVVLRTILWSIGLVFSKFSIYMRSFAALDRANQILALDTELSAKEPSYINGGKIGRIAIRNLTFSYQGERPLFESLALDFETGKAYALVGGSGSGKTTLIKILLGFYESGSMEVLLNGKSTGLKSLGGLVSIVPANNALFGMSIYENIAFSESGTPAITRAECATLAQALGIHQWIDSLPEKYDTIVQTDSANMSGGQRQAICILRAFASSAPIIILDEPFSALDREKERHLVQAINNIKRERIVIVTSHRESSIGEIDGVIDLSRLAKV